MQRKDYVKTQKADVHLQAKEKGLEQTLPSWPLGRTNPVEIFDPGLVASSTMRK